MQKDLLEAGVYKRVDITVDNKPVQSEAANHPPTAVADIPMVRMLVQNRGEHQPKL